MNDDVIQDLKQFIENTVSQSEQRIKSELRDDLGGRIDKLEQKVDSIHQDMQEGFAAIGDALSGVNDQLEDHDQRISKLEPART